MVSANPAERALVFVFTSGWCLAPLARLDASAMRGAAAGASRVGAAMYVGMLRACPETDRGTR